MSKAYTIRDVARICGGFPGAGSYFPFGPQPECFRVGGKIFAELYSEGVKGALTILLDPAIPREQICPMVTLRCNPEFGDFIRQQYPNTVLRPYHSPPARQPYANTVLMNGGISNDVLEALINHAYRYVVNKLPLRMRAELLLTKEE